MSQRKILIVNKFKTKIHKSNDKDKDFWMHLTKEIFLYIIKDE